MIKAILGSTALTAALAGEASFAETVNVSFEGIMACSQQPFSTPPVAGAVPWYCSSMVSPRPRMTLS